MDKNQSNQELTETVVTMEALLKKEQQIARRKAIVAGLKKFGAQVAITVGAGVASHFLLKAILPDEEQPSDDELHDMIEATVEPDEED